MPRYLDAKCRLCRREGVKLFLKGSRCFSPKCPIERKGAVPPGQGGVKKSFRRLSEYGQQLREKQKLKRTYGIREKQLKKLFKEARKHRGATGTALINQIERRLDNVVFRLGLASSRSVSRQIISHKHVLVNNRKVNIASYRIKKDDIISLDKIALKIPEVKKTLDQKENKLPSWLERKGAIGRVKNLPSEADFLKEIDLKLIVEYYSR